MSLMEKIANVFDALGADADRRAPSIKTAAVDPLIAAVEARTGAPLSNETRAKLASDPEVRRALERLVETPEPTRPMGAPAEKAAAATPAPSSAQGKAERLAEAHNNFARTVLGYNG